MNLLDSPYFGMLRDRLDQLSTRQRLISENIANAATPGFQPRDIDTTAFQRAAASRGTAAGSVTVMRTHPGHVAPDMGAGASGTKIVVSPDTETTIDGNSVVLEDQMVKAAETRMAFESGLALYQKGLQLIRMASRKPGA